MMKLMTAFQKEWLELVRTKRLLIALVVLVLFGMTSPLMAKMIPEIMTLVPGGEQFALMIPTPSITDAVAQYIKNITQFGVLLALLFGMGSVANEKDKGTAAMILSKPMPRFTFLIAKIAANTLLFRAGTLAGRNRVLLLYICTIWSTANSWIRANERVDPVIPAGICSLNGVLLNPHQNTIHRHGIVFWSGDRLWHRQRHPGFDALRPGCTHRECHFIGDWQTSAKLDRPLGEPGVNSRQRTGSMAGVQETGNINVSRETINNKRE